MFEQIRLKNGNEAFNVSKDCLRELNLIVNYRGHKLKTKKKYFVTITKFAIAAECRDGFLMLFKLPT